MPRSRAFAVTGTTPTNPRSRGVGVTGSGTVQVTPRSRGIRVSGSGANAVTVNPIADQVDIEPGTTITLTASLAGGTVADSWTWRRVSGAAVGIVGTGPIVSLEAPAAVDGATVVIGVRATVGGVTSTERTVTLSVLPHTEYWWTGSGWAPRFDLFENTPVTPPGPADIGTRVFGGRMGTINAATPTTFQVTCALAQHFDEVRLVFGNISTTTPGQVNGVAVSVIGAPSDLNNSAGTWVPGTKGGSSSFPTAVASAANRIGYTVTDWIPISSIPRTDGNTLPLLVVRAYMAGNTALSGYGNGTDSFTNWAARTTGRLWAARDQTVDGVTTPGGFTSTTNRSQSPIVGVQYKARGQVVTVGAVGDSITEGRGTYLNEGFVMPATVDLSSMAGVAVEYANFGWSGSRMAYQFGPRTREIVNSPLRPDVMVFPSGSPNDIGGTIDSGEISVMASARADMLAACSEKGVVPVVWTWLPTNTSVKDYGSTDSLRTSENAAVLSALGGSVRVVDTSTALSGVTTNGQVQMLAGSTSDNIHPNDSGNATLKNLLKPVLANAIAALN